MWTKSKNYGGKNGGSKFKNFYYWKKMENVSKIQNETKSKFKNEKEEQINKINEDNTKLSNEIK